MGERFQFRLGNGGPLFDLHPDGYPARFTATGAASGVTVSGVAHTPTAVHAAWLTADACGDPPDLHLRARRMRFEPGAPAFWSYRRAAEFLARHVKSWDVRAADGFVVPVTVDAVLALPRDVQEELVPVVMGYRGCRLLTRGPAEPAGGGDPGG